MTWSLSRFRAGDLVEVRTKEEILATLDEGGRLDGMPFMPEMLQYCGYRFRVGAVAHKTCETARKTFKARKLEATVHLTDLRCDGTAHGGCQASCNLFWKDAWLRVVAEKGKDTDRTVTGEGMGAEACTEADLLASTRLATNDGEEPRYSCQATELYEATEPLAWWDLRQYLFDVVTRNRSFGHVLRVLWLAFVKHVHRKAPYGYRLTRAIYKSSHNLLTGREAPDFRGLIPRNQPTPTGRLLLNPGERVRIKSKEEIVKTLRERGDNRGLYFDVEMSRYCGSIVTVRCSVNKIIDELTGKMRYMKEPCIMLDGVVCNSEYSENRLMCPRAFPSYWREIWLERVASEEQPEP